ncbi:nucleotidyltransferase domain-containing protein [Kribbella capetownensis]|uniref:Nucleotidyltransferase domain-containing protein n=1 Tax=Kribbella capetownensis TaxID=1572659 RepID=A0A4V2M824_9ACTN|nr:nucleotidyltransferase domain-containing protein [Kribbella capetownensis]TCC49802.1 nucleotidyltransferase domain-containing protein [Kribbella capetownensis]
MDPKDLARQLVVEQYPDARAAWLGGSVARGDASSTSDLDITVLLDGPPAPLRKSLEYGGWPVELFVHTEKSLAYFSDKDQKRRQPTMMRLVGESVVLLDRDGSGAHFQQAGQAEVAAGPAPLSTSELELLRYTITGLLDDLADASGDVRTALCSALWQDAARLLLTGARHWSGTGKGLLREVMAYDESQGTDHATALMDGVRAEDDSLVEEVDRILQPYGGRLFSGFELTGTTP